MIQINKKINEKDSRYFFYEYFDCIERILMEPTAVDVDYYFYHMHQLEQELQEIVNDEQMKERLRYEG